MKAEELLEKLNHLDEIENSAWDYCRQRDYYEKFGMDFGMIWARRIFRFKLNLIKQFKSKICGDFIDWLEINYPEWEEAIQDIRSLMKEFLKAPEP